MSELLFPLRRLRFALRLGWQSACLGWRIAGGIHAEARRVEREIRECPLDALVLADQALYDDVLTEAGTGVLRRAFDE